MRTSTCHEISMLMLLNIQEFLEKAGRGEVTLPNHLIKEFKESCSIAVKKQFNRDENSNRIRMSGLGKPVCQQQLAMQNIPKTTSYNDIMRFLFGDLIEAVAILVMKASGIKVISEQKKCNLIIGNEDIKGTLDVIIDEDGEKKVWDIKSASPYAFEYKFGRGYGAIKEDDAFGYVMQGHLYGTAQNLPFGGWIVVNKSTGEWAVIEAPDDQTEERKAMLKQADETVKAIKSKKFKIPFKDEWETYKQDGEIKRTRNRILPKLCSFCEYKTYCWPKATYRQKITSKAKTPPQVWYSKYDQKSV